MSNQNSPTFFRLMELCTRYETLQAGPERQSVEAEIVAVSRALAKEQNPVSEPVVQETLAQVISLDLRRAKDSLEKNLIDKALNETHGNKSQAAKLLGITREGLRKAMKKVA